MEFLRSSFIASVVSLLVLTSYAHDLFGGCDDHRRATPIAVGQVSSHPTKGVPPHSEDNCQCLCHQAISNVIVEPVALGRALPVKEISFVARGEFPPDAEPRGIDHPPQLA